MDQEPALIVGAIAAVLNVVAAFIPSIGTTQLGLLNAAVVAIAAAVTRSKVSPV